MKRKRRNGRADDQGRLVEEHAKGVGPQAKRVKAKPAPTPEPPPEPPPKRKPGRPRVRPLPDPAAPKRPRGRPPKAAKADPAQMAPDVEPDEVELPPAPKDEAGRPLSELWDAVRAHYRSPRVRNTVERLMRSGSLELDDLVWLELAEHEQLGQLLDGAGERLQERLVSARLQSRKQVMRIIVERGPVGGVNARNVRVPPGLELEELTRPPDMGDDVLAEPVVEDLPERYREVAMMQRGTPPP